MREVKNNIRNWKEIVARCRRMKFTRHSSYCTRLSLDTIIIFNSNFIKSIIYNIRKTISKGA